MDVISRVLGSAALIVVASTVLTGCSPGTSLAYHVTDEAVDIAFCEEFSATAVTIDFGDYPPPFMGPLASIAVQKASGAEAEFGAGRPLSVSIAGWSFARGSDPIPDEWDRIDFSFFDSDGDYVEGTHLLRTEVTSTQWAWTEGFNIAEPLCDLALG